MGHYCCRTLTKSKNLGLIVAAATVVMWEDSNQKRQQPAQLEEEDLSRHSPIPPLRVLRPNPDLEICYDTRTRNAVYVQHRIVVDDGTTRTNNGTQKKKHRRGRFREDTSIEEHYRSRNSFYHLTGYDRGHLAPAADFPATCTSRGGQKNDTYNLCNASPQDPEMNRNIWAWLEEVTRRAAKRAWEEHDEAVTYVTTGPLWLPSSQIDDKIFCYKNVLGIGRPPTLVMVPTHFFKVVVVTDRDHHRILQFACFVIPNSAAANDKPLDAYSVRWTDLETVSGLTFYPSLANDAFKARADASTSSLPSLGGSSSNSQMLLTNGGKESTSRTMSATHNMIPDLRHLCEDQACLQAKHQP